MVPFKGISPQSAFVPLDLVYLDDACRVIDVVEYFPTFFVSPASPPATSVLALPVHSIHASRTRPGDQLILCAVDEMKRRLNRSPVTGSEAIMVSPSGKAPVESGKKQEAKSCKKEIDSPKGWLERWIFPDPPSPLDQRKAPRRPAPGLAAYFWTGSIPSAHKIRDISSCGLYVETSERWYPGTVVRMTLTKSDGKTESAERSISVQAKAIRWGNDGVGLQFIFQESHTAPCGQCPPLGELDSKRFDQFLNGPDAQGKKVPTGRFKFPHISE
jgi:hypothetical protein